MKTKKLEHNWIWRLTQPSLSKVMRVLLTLPFGTLKPCHLDGYINPYQCCWICGQKLMIFSNWQTQTLLQFIYYMCEFATCSFVFIFLLVNWYSWSSRWKSVVISRPSKFFSSLPTMYFLTLKSLHNILLFHFRWRRLNYKLSWWYSWCSWWITKRCTSGPTMGGGIFGGGCVGNIPKLSNKTKNRHFGFKAYPYTLALLYMLMAYLMEQ